MPGSIKIDDGSGNYTILTNAGSLGSDKTLTIPNETATLATTTAKDLGGLVLLYTSTASDDPTLTLDNFVDLSTYPSYYIVMSRIIPANDDVELRFVFRQGGGSGSDLTGTYNQGGYYVYVDHSNGAGNFGNNSKTDYQVWDNNVGSGSAEACVGEATLFPATGSTDGNVSCMNHINMKQRSDDTMRYIQRATFKEDVTAVTGIKFYFSSGNIASGTIRVYGVKS